MMKQNYKVAFACFDCHKSFKRPVDFSEVSPRTMVCPHCGGQSVNLGRKFKPPRSSDAKQWQKVAYLYAHGYHFRSVYVPLEDASHAYIRVKYPKTLADAKRFVHQYHKVAHTVVVKD